MCAEVCFVSQLQWVVSLRYPDIVPIAHVFLTKQTHHGFVEGVLDVHVSTSVHSCYLLHEASQEGVAAPREGLECHHVASHVYFLIKEAQLAILLEISISRQVFA